MLRVVFFDAAGTLIEPREPPGESYARLARGYGLKASSQAVTAGFRHAFHQAPALAFGSGHSAAELRRRERGWWREVVRKTFAEIDEIHDFDGYFAALFDFFGDPANWSADPVAKPLLEQLKARGLHLGIISNFDHRLYRILDGLGLRGFFDSVTISSEAGWAKPAPEIFHAALERNGFAAADAVHVGDVAHLDVAGAEAAGLAAILLDPAAPQRVVVSGRRAAIATLAAVPEALAALTFP